MKRTTRETWRARVERWRASGKRADEFAAEIGVSAKSLTWWKWMLSSERRVSAKSTSKRAPAQSSALTKRHQPISPVTFVEMTAAVASDAIDVVLPSRVRVAVRPGFDDTTLSRVLDVLEKRS